MSKENLVDFFMFWLLGVALSFGFVFINYGLIMSLTENKWNLVLVAICFILMSAPWIKQKKMKAALMDGIEIDGRFQPFRAVIFLYVVNLLWILLLVLQYSVLARYDVLKMDFAWWRIMTLLGGMIIQIAMMVWSGVLLGRIMEGSAYREALRLQRGFFERGL